MNEVFFVAGGIACGKSSFMQKAINMGFATLNADTIAHQILDEYAFSIQALFKEQNYIKANTIDRKKLGAKVFSDKKALQKLEAFMHPKIEARLLEALAILQQKKQKYGVIFIEMPLFFELKAYHNLGKSVLIYAPLELSLKRLMQRNALNQTQALQRIKAQMDIEKKRKLADFIIENLGSFKEFEQKCEAFLNQYKELE